MRHFIMTGWPRFDIFQNYEKISIDKAKYCAPTMKIAFDNKVMKYFILYNTQKL